MIIAERLERTKREFIDDLQMSNFLQRSQQKAKSQPPKNCDHIDTSNLQMSFNDPLYCFEWYLVRVLLAIKLNEIGYLSRKIKDN